MESKLARPKVSTPSVFRGRFRCPVNSIVQGGIMAQVKLRLSRETLEKLDRWVSEGKFKSRSDAVRTLISFYEERERTREFLKMLMKRSEEARKHHESLVSLEEV
jgi:Arc/MetJ-type ribon-helix-helix transcriptional regulator